MCTIFKNSAVSDLKIITEESGPVIFPLYKYLQILENILGLLDNFDMKYKKVKVSVRSA
jgi:hypothetical protein